MTSRPVGSTIRWAAAAGTRYWTPHWAARRTSTGSPTVRPSTVHDGPPRRTHRATGARRGGVGRRTTAAMECSTAHAAIPWLVAYWILKVVLSPVFFLLWRVKIEGREHIPMHGPAVLAANHQSFCDSFFLPLVLQRRVTYVAKAEYFDDWKTAWFFRAAGQIPMSRSGGDASQRALDTATEVLNTGHLLGIYPEGTRAPDPPTAQGPHRGGPAVAAVRRADHPGGDRGHEGGPAAREQRDAAVPCRDHPVRAPGDLLCTPADGDHRPVRRAPSATASEPVSRDLDQAELRCLTDTLMTRDRPTLGPGLRGSLRQPGPAGSTGPVRPAGPAGRGPAGGAAAG